MGLPNVHITLANGALGRVAGSSDGVAGLLVTGAAVAGKLELNKVYLLSDLRSLESLGITKENNPLAYKEVTAFYTQAGDGAELYLLVASAATTLAQLCAVDAASPLRKLIDYGRGRIRLVGVNRLAPEGYVPVTAATGIDADVVAALTAAESVAKSYRSKVMPFRVLLPGYAFSGSLDKLFKPREGSYNSCGVVLCADAKIGTVTSPAVGQVLGRAASIPVYRSIARVKDGAITQDGWLADGNTVEYHAALLDALNDAGYIIYRSFVGKNGYYLNDDPTAAPLSDDYSSLSLGRVIDKAIAIAYSTYIDEIQDSVEVDESGKLPKPLCTYFEGIIEDAVALQMAGEISGFNALIDPTQNILSTSRLTVSCRIRPKGMLKDIDVNLGFTNPATSR
jgi:hypothetical protein